MEPLATEPTKQGIHLLAAIRDFPLWLLAGCAISFGVFLVPPLDSVLPGEAKSWIIVGAVFSTAFTILRALALAPQALRAWRAQVEARKRFHMTPNPQRCFWGAGRQADGSTNTQIDLSLTVKNKTAASLTLTHARLISPSIAGELMADYMSIEGRGGLDAVIPSGRSASIRVSMIYRGTETFKKHAPIRALFGVADDEGHEEKVRLVVKRAFGAAIARRKWGAWLCHRVYILVSHLKNALRYRLRRTF
jgi:hypothetical protein